MAARKTPPPTRSQKHIALPSIGTMKRTTSKRLIDILGGASAVPASAKLPPVASPAVADPNQRLPRATLSRYERFLVPAEIAEIKRYAEVPYFDPYARRVKPTDDEPNHGYDNAEGFYKFAGSARGRISSELIFRGMELRIRLTTRSDATRTTTWRTGTSFSRTWALVCAAAFIFG